MNPLTDLKGPPALTTDFFDLHPGAIICDPRQPKPIYRKTAAYGRFGRDDVELPWERTDKAEALKRLRGCKSNS